MSDVSFIHMSSLGNRGAADVTIPLTPGEESEHHRRNPWRCILDLSITQMLAFICGIMAFVIIGLALTVGFALTADSNQKTHINQQGIQINEMNSRLDNLESRIATLEKR